MDGICAIDNMIRILHDDRIILLGDASFNAANRWDKHVKCAQIVLELFYMPK